MSDVDLEAMSDQELSEHALGLVIVSEQIKDDLKEVRAEMDKREDDDD